MTAGNGAVIAKYIVGSTHTHRGLSTHFVRHRGVGQHGFHDAAIPGVSPATDVFRESDLWNVVTGVLIGT